MPTNAREYSHFSKVLSKLISSSLSTTLAMCPRASLASEAQCLRCFAMKSCRILCASSMCAVISRALCRQCRTKRDTSSVFLAAAKARCQRAASRAGSASRSESSAEVPLSGRTDYMLRATHGGVKAKHVVAAMSIEHMRGSVILLSLTLCSRPANSGGSRGVAESGCAQF